MSITCLSSLRSDTFSANSSSSARSCSMSSRAPGRWTFTTTRSPLASVARCTWAIVPAASGVDSIESNTSSHGTPSSCSITVTTCSSESGGTWSCSEASSSMNSGGSRSGSRRQHLTELGERRSQLLEGRRAAAWPGGGSRCCRPRPAGRRAPSGRAVAITDAIFVPARHEVRLGSRQPRCPGSTVLWRGSAVAAFPSGANVLTMITVHRALWLIRFGTLPRRNSLRPAIPALPTTRTSISSSSVACTIAMAGSSSTTTFACPRSPASCRA